MKLEESSVAPAHHPPPEHWLFLDGMRGLASLAVVLFHIREERLATLSPPAQLLSSVFHFGHEAVCVFIVLSGFCLMLPVSRSLSHADPARRGILFGGFGGFMTRRARRILPAFYAAALLSLTQNLYSKEVLGALLRGNVSSLHLGSLAPGLVWDNLLSYLFLVHNYQPVSPQRTPNYPLWSVGLEWQIYFGFALLLFPLWRKKGIGWPLALSFVFGISTYFLLPIRLYLWFVGLFAMGMLASDLAYAPEWADKPWNNPKSFGRLSLLMLALGFAFKYLTLNENLVLGEWLSDTAFGAATAAFILALIGRARLGEHSTANQFLSSRPLLFLGAISYSTYLIHKPILLKFGALSAKFTHQFSPDVLLFTDMLLGIPTVLLLAFLFHCVFERPFLRRRTA